MKKLRHCPKKQCRKKLGDFNRRIMCAVRPSSSGSDKNFPTLQPHFILDNTTSGK